MTEKFAIYGTGGFAREVLGPLVYSTSVISEAQAHPDIVFVDDNMVAHGTKVHGRNVISYELAREQGCRFCIAIGNGKIRKALAEQISEDGGRFFSISSPTLISYENISVGQGAIFCDHVILTADATIGVHFHANIYSYVAHDCRIGDYVTFAPRVCCNGNVTIGDGVYVGTGAFLKQGITIGESAVIGMGAVVTKDVPPRTTVVGNPASAMNK